MDDPATLTSSRALKTTAMKRPVRPDGGAGGTRGRARDGGERRGRPPDSEIGVFGFFFFFFLIQQVPRRDR